MPPKCKFTREEIIKVALDIVKKDGAFSITARSLGAKLGSSSKPIFSIFKNMEEVQMEVTKAAKVLYAEYVQIGLKQELPFKGVGTQYILFAIREPKLFQLLFMTEQPQQINVTGILPIIDESYEQILKSVQSGYNLSKKDAENLYRHLWIYTHGIAVLCATNMCSFTYEEISRMMTEVCVSLLKEIKRSK
ncbi:MAG: TetR/AcrR family transcriptional regulator [Erysipelotrichales bacterium]|nr:TetR/AcrR family transcriptional regulator [Erysipelotrichales bacterium]